MDMIPLLMKIFGLLISASSIHGICQVNFQSCNQFTLIFVHIVSLKSFCFQDMLRRCQMIKCGISFVEERLSIKTPPDNVSTDQHRVATGNQLVMNVQ